MNQPVVFFCSNFFSTGKNKTLVWDDTAVYSHSKTLFWLILLESLLLSDYLLNLQLTVLSTLLFILVLQGKLYLPCTILQIFLEFLGDPSNWFKLALSCPVLSYLSFNQIQSWEFLSYLSLGKDLSSAALTKFSSDRDQGGAVLSYLSFDQKFELGCPVLFDFRLTSYIWVGTNCRFTE